MCEWENSEKEGAHMNVTFASDAITHSFPVWTACPVYLYPEPVSCDFSPRNYPCQGSVGKKHFRTLFLLVSLSVCTFCPSLCVYLSASLSHTHSLSLSLLLSVFLISVSLSLYISSSPHFLPFPRQCMRQSVRLDWHAWWMCVIFLVEAVRAWVQPRGHLLQAHWLTLICIMVHFYVN